MEVHPPKVWDGCVVVVHVRIENAFYSRFIGEGDCSLLTMLSSMLFVPFSQQRKRYVSAGRTFEGVVHDMSNDDTLPQPEDMEE